MENKRRLRINRVSIERKMRMEWTIRETVALERYDLFSQSPSGCGDGPPYGAAWPLRPALPRQRGVFLPQPRFEDEGGE